MMCNRMIKAAGIAAMAFLVLLLTACPVVGLKQVEIDRKGWFLNNYPDDYFTASATPLHTINFIFHYAGENVQASDFLSVLVENRVSQDSWDVSLDPGDFDIENSEIYLHLIATSLDAGRVLPLGVYDFTFRLADGQTLAAQITVPPCGASEWAGEGYSFIEGSSMGATSAQVPMLKRATVSGANYNGSTLQVDFTVADAKVYSGWLWLYDVSGNFIGRSLVFRDYQSGACNTLINGGASFDTAGLSNAVLLDASNAFFSESSASLADVKQVRVILTDGRQHEGTTVGWDARSLSLAVNVN